MADEIVFDDGEGNGVGTLNTGDSGINDGNSSSSTGNQGGGGAGPTITASSTSGTDSDTGGNTGSGTSDDFSQKEQEIDDILAKWMAISAIGLAFDQVVKLYVENKLGFGPKGETLKKKYKEKNPDIDPDAVDKAVDQQLKDVTEEFTTPGTSAKEELQAKYNEFKTASFEVLGNLEKMGSELAKTIANAYMPTSIGPVAPNPLSVALKLYVGLTALKKLIDRVVIAMTMFMAAARSIGADESDPYINFINSVHNLLASTMKSVKDQEEEGDNLKNVAKAEYLLEAKNDYKVTSLVTGNQVSAKELEEMARNEFEIYIWPLESSDLNKLYNILGVHPAVGMIPGVGVIAAFVDLATTTDKERRARMLVDYNNFLATSAYQFEQDWQIQLESESSGGTTTSSGSNATDAGGNDKGPGGDVNVGTK